MNNFDVETFLKVYRVFSRKNDQDDDFDIYRDNLSEYIRGYINLLPKKHRKLAEEIAQAQFDFDIDSQRTSETGRASLFGNPYEY